MDRHIEYNTRKECEETNDNLWEVMKARAVKAGYVVDGGIVGKNAATGEDAHNKTKTTRYDEVKESKDGTFYVMDMKDLTAKEFGADKMKALKLNRKETPRSWKEIPKEFGADKMKALKLNRKESND